MATLLWMSGMLFLGMCIGVLIMSLVHVDNYHTMEDLNRDLAKAERKLKEKEEIKANFIRECV